MAVFLHGFLSSSVLVEVSGKPWERRHHQVAGWANFNEKQEREELQAVRLRPDSNSQDIHRKELGQSRKP
jgi:hypothetical protein